MAKKKKLVKYSEWQKEQGETIKYDEWLKQDSKRQAEKQKKLQNERTSKMTDLWRNSAAHEQNEKGINERGVNVAPSTYAAKMMTDSHSSVEKENERRQKVNNYLEGLKKSRQEKQEASSFSNWKAANKNKPDTSYRKTIGKSTTELEDMLIQAGKKPKTETAKEQPAKKERYSTVDDYNTYLRKAKKLQQEGAFDDDKNPMRWSDKGLVSAKDKMQSQIDDIDKELEGLQTKQKNKEEWYPQDSYNGWAHLYEEMKDGRIKNGRDLLSYLDDDANIMSRAKDYKIGGEIRDDEEGWRRAGEKAFNYVFGYSDENSGYYDLITEGMSEAEKADFDNKLVSIIGGMKNPYSDFNYDAEAGELTSQRDRLTGEMDKWTEEQNRRQTIADLEANAPDATGIPDPERRYVTEGNNPMQLLVNGLTGTQGDDMDRTFWAIRDQKSKWNSMTTAEKIDMLNQLNGSNSHDGLAESLQDTTTAYGQYYAFMQPEEQKTFEGYYLSGDKESARAYMEALRPYLQMYANEYSKSVAEEAATGDYGWFYGLKSIADAPMNAAVSMIGTGLAALGNKEAGSANSTWFRGQNIQNATREGRKEAWGHTAERLLGSWAKAPAEFLNGVFYSMADMAVATGIGGTLSTTSEISEPLVQFVMSSEAASNTMTEQLERGIDPREAALYAVGSGVIEWFTEKVSVQELLNPNVKEMLGNKKQLAKFIAKNTIAEGSEEGASSILEIGLDALLSAINGHESELQEKYNQLKGQVGEKNAARQVLMEQLQQTGMEMLAGGVSGLLMSSARVGTNTIEQRSTGQQIRTAETSGSSGTDVIIDAALNLKEDMQSRKLAEEMAEKRQRGKDITDIELGRLAQNLQHETTEIVAKTARTVVEDRAYDKLEDSGMDDAQRREMAQIISNAVTNGVESLTKQERSTILANREAFSVLKEFTLPTETSREAVLDIAEQTKGEREVQQSVSELLNKDIRKQTQNAEDAGETLATEEDIQNAEGERTGGGREVIIDGKWAKLGNLVSVKEKDENGKEITKLKWQIAGTNETVDASQIKATDFATASIIRQAQVNPGMFSNGFTNTLLQANDKGEIKNVGRFLLEAQKIRIASYIGQQLPMTTMQRATAQAIFDQAKYEREKNRANDLKGSNAGKQGKITFQGAEYGTKEWNEKIKKIASKNQRAQIDAIAGIAQRAGIEVTFRDAAEVAAKQGVTDAEKYYGWENSEGITVNVEGLDFALNENLEAEAKGSHNMLVTFGHEMTHWLQRNSLDGYNKLEAYVLGEMGKGGVNVSRRVQEVMQQRDLNIEDAISEIVADSCDQILANEEVASHIQETNQGLFKEIKSFVKDLVGRVKAAVVGMDESRSRDARAMLKSANGLAKVWLGAYDEAISGTIKQTEDNDDGKIRLSQADDVEDRQLKIQVNSHLDEIMATESVADISTDIDLSEYKDALDYKAKYKAWAADLLSKIGWRVYRDGLGYVEINKTRINKGLGYRMSNQQRAAFAAVPITIQKGMEINFHKEHKGNADVEESHTFAAKIMVDGKPKVMAVAVVLTQGENRYKTHKVFLPNGEVWTIDEKAESGSVERNDSQLPRPSASEKRISQNDQAGKTRKSMAQLDSDYKQAVKDGNEQRQQELVDQAAKDNGYTMKVYHGTPYGGFTQFRDWSYFTQNKDYADRYNHPSQSSTRGRYDAATQPMTYGLYMNPGRVFDTRQPEARKLFNQIRMEQGMSELTERGLPDWTDGRDLIDYVEENNLPYDTIILDEGADGGYGEPVVPRGESYVTRSNMVKSADPVTSDDNGNVIPLSKRFNKGNNDIRFSTAQVEKTLEDSGEIAAEPVRYSFAGYMATDRFMNDVRRAQEMEDQGRSEEEIREETNCIRGFRGKWWRILDNNGMQLTIPQRDIQPGTSYRLSDVYLADELYEAYPQLSRIILKFEDLGTKGGVFAQTNGRSYITINTAFERDIEGVEASLQHELQHMIQTIEGSHSGSNETFWKDMQDVAQARIRMNDGFLKTVLDKAGLDPETDLAFGIEFNEDGTVDEEWLFPEELEKVRHLSDEDLRMYRKTVEDSEKWMKLLQGNRTPNSLYRNTVGEIEARAASVKTDADTALNYDDFTVATEDYTGRKVNTRLSMAEPVETTKDLIAVHNLEADQLMKILRLGGFAMPSIAIIRDNYAHNRYGGVSVLFRKDTIDPQMFRSNKVYGGDAWTPTYPSVEYKLNEKEFKNIRKRIESLVPADIMRSLQYQGFDTTNMQRDINSFRGDIATALKDKMLYQMAYLADKGEEIEYPMKEQRLDRSGNFQNSQVLMVLDMLGEETVEQAYSEGYRYIEEHPDMVEQIRQALNNQFREENKGAKLKLLQRDLYSQENFGMNKVYNLIDAAGRYLNTGLQQELDENALKDRIKQQVSEDEGYIPWLNDLFSGIIEKRGLRNNKSFYTNSGNPRSWEALHDEETLENVVRIMKEQADKGEAAFFSQSALLALGTRDFRSIDDIRAHKGQLKHLTDEEMSAAKTEIINKVSEIQEEIKDKSERNDFIARDRALQAIAEAVRRGKTVQAIDRELRQWNGLTIHEDTAQRIVEVMQEIADLPTEYFEAKPQRAVGLDEIATVILPEDTDQSLIDALEERKIPYETYNGTDEDRLRVMNEQEDVKFSKYTSETMDVTAWMMAQSPGSVQTEAERQLLEDYRGLRIKISLSIKRQLDYKAEIKKLEDHLADLTPAQKEDLAALYTKLQTQQEKQADLENELYKVTSSEGYAGMMRHYNIVLNDFITGKTQDQVRESVEQMIDQVKASEKIIEKQAKMLRKMAESQAVKAVSSMINKKSLNYAVKSLKDSFNTSMGKTELESRLTEMALKRANGEDITEDARELAIDMTNQTRGYQNDVLERMRGVTIVIGPDQQKEMKGNGMTLASVRQQLKGTGVKVKYGDYSSLDTDTVDGGDLRTLLPELPQDIGENSGDALFKFISWAQSMRDTDQGMKQEMVDIEDAAVSTLAIASTIEVNMNSPEYRKQNQMAAQTMQMAGELEQAGRSMTEKTEEAGLRARGWASTLQRDVNEAIKYYNTIARKAAQEEKNKVRKNVIEQLKSQHTADLIKQEQKYKEMMKNDRKARMTAEDIMTIRNGINTVARRVRKRLMEETDAKNIPEEAKPLARQMLKMLVQHDFVGYRHVLFASKQMREQTMAALDSWEKRDGEFKDEDLDWLIVGSGQDADWTVRDNVVNALIDIESGLLEYRAAEGRGHITLMDRKAALKKVDNAVEQIWSVIAARETANLNYKQMLVSELAMQARDDMQHSRFKGEWTGKIGHGLGAIRSGVVYGNMTPEYFFKNLRNRTISQLYDEYHRAENRNGLEVGKAKAALAKIAEETGYSTWDQEKRYTFQLEKGGTVSLTLGEMMSLYATWKREAMNQAELNGPEQSFHLEVGGFYTAQEEEHRIIGREKFLQKAHRLTGDDIAKIQDSMTQEQVDYVERVVRYMTEDIGTLGNEASMRMYGIKKYNEKWYFPFEIWSGVKSKKSDQGAAGTDENRAAHASFTKRRRSNANNALVIRDFTETAVKHIGQMINYNTFAPAIEFMNRVMNYQLTEEGEGKDSTTKRNLRTIFGEIYGKDAIDYLDNFNKDVNGGVVRGDVTVYDKLLSTFKKSAVAGSLSVAAQQPLSYIRAAMMINPKYLAAAINPAYYKGSKAEMEKYSGVAVIKAMGKFDMNFGQSARDYMMPDRKTGKGKAVYSKISDISTALPELMDMMTWTRMWTACKLEQQAQNPGMDHNSKEFMEKVAERFNDVMRKTQVYDSVLVKSKNMRSQNKFLKSVTSFMAEPTLTANVLADAVINVKEKGGKATLAKAGTTFILSAILQALVKGAIGTGRNPQEDKTWKENLAYRFASNLIGEINPASLIPGYSDLMELLMKGELSDDALGVVGKIFDAVETGGKLIRGEKGSAYRYVEDSVGQLAQLFTNIPAKNIMRDARAMWNFIVDQPYAKRENSKAVLYYQLMDLLHNSQNLTGVINQKVFGDKGWETKNAAYYKRIYAADKAGKKQKVDDMIEYLKLARNTKQETINTGIRGLVKQDSKLTEQQKLDMQKKYGLKDGSSYITGEYKDGNIDRKTAEAMYRKENPGKEDKSVWETFDRIDYTKAGKLEDGQYYSSYLPLYDAIESGSQAEIHNAVKKMLSYGYKKENIKKQLGNQYKQQYIDATVEGRKRLADKLTKAYKEIGVSGTEALKIMQKWVTDTKKKKKKSEGK